MWPTATKVTSVSDETLHRRRVEFAAGLPIGCVKGRRGGVEVFRSFARAQGMNGIFDRRSVGLSALLPAASISDLSAMCCAIAFSDAH